MNIVPLTRMSADHVHRYSTNRNFSGNSVDPDQILHYAPYDGARGADNKIHIHVGHG